MGSSSHFTSVSGGSCVVGGVVQEAPRQTARNATKWARIAGLGMWLALALSGASRTCLIKVPSPSVSRRTAKHAEPLQRLGGKLQGKLTCRELPSQCGSLSRIERAEAGGVLRFCFRAQRRERSSGQGKGWNASCERPQFARDAIHENTSWAPG